MKEQRQVGTTATKTILKLMKIEIELEEIKQILKQLGKENISFLAANQAITLGLNHFKDAKEQVKRGSDEQRHLI